MRFYFVDKVTAFEAGVQIHGVKNVSMSEPYFSFHFQRFPVMPGVLIIESLAQLAGFLIELTLDRDQSWKKAILSIVDRTKFKTMVRPGDQIEMEARLVNLAENGAACEVKATCNGRLVAETSLTFALADGRDVVDDWLEAERQALITTLMRDVPGWKSRE